MSRVVQRNLEALLKRRKEEEARKSRQDSWADAVTRFTGSMTFVYLHLLLFGTWIVWNSGLFGVWQFDPSYVVLAMFASVEAIFLSTFVLISQNRMNVEADKRAELDLQISLLAEHEISRLAAMIHAIAKKTGAELPDEEEIDEISSEVRPEHVMDEMEKYKRKMDGESGKI